MSSRLQLQLMFLFLPSSFWLALGTPSFPQIFLEVMENARCEHLKYYRSYLGLETVLKS